MTPWSWLVQVDVDLQIGYMGYNTCSHSCMEHWMWMYLFSVAMKEYSIYNVYILRVSQLKT